MKPAPLSKTHNYLQLMRFHKPVGIFLLLWPTLWALWIATSGHPPLSILLIFVLGTIVMRAAGCVINDIADRDIDRHVTRTQNRPITSGKISTRSAFILFSLLYLMALGLVSQLNKLSIELAVIAGGVAILYPFSKRWTNWPQLILGIAFSFSILMAFSATIDKLPMLAWWLFATNVLWTLSYDTEYAMVDRPDDEKLPIKSTALLFGKYDRLIISALQISIIASLIGLGLYLKYSWPYYTGVIIASGLFLHHQTLLKQQTPTAYFKAFLSNNYFGLVIFAAIFLSYLS